jgi:hypothetical protein
MSHQPFQNCIEACQACAVACSHCATQCLWEDDVKMMRLVHPAGPGMRRHLPGRGGSDEPGRRIQRPALPDMR